MIPLELPLEVYVEIAAAVVAGIGAISVATRRILAALRRNFEQTQPNGGNSLRDCVTRIEKCVNEVRALNVGYLNLTGGGVFTADKEGQCTWVSREWSNLTGVTHEDALGGGWLAGVASEDQMRVQDEWTLFVGSRGAIKFESLFSTAKGTPVRGHAVPVEGDPNSPEEISGYFGRFAPTN